MIHCEVIYDTHYTWNYDNEQVGTWEDYGILYNIRAKNCQCYYAIICFPCKQINIA